MKDLDIDEACVAEELEVLWKKTKLKGTTFLPLILVPVGIIMVIVSNFIFLDSAVNWLAFPSVILIFGGIAWFFILLGPIGEAQKNYVSAYKQKLAEKVIMVNFDNAHYYPGAGISREEFEESRVYPEVSSKTLHSEDLIIGEFHGVEFKQSDVKITYRKDGHTFTAINGIVLRFKMQKEIQGRVRLVSIFSYNAQYAGKPYGSEVVVPMEDVDFNQKFRCFAEDTHSVFYLLTPPLMECLKKLRDKYQFLYISCGGDYMYILISGRGGIFDWPGNPSNIPKEIKKCQEDIQDICNVVEALHLDEKQRQEEALDAALHAEEGQER